jgi:hypothetical protein
MYMKLTMNMAVLWPYEWASRMVAQGFTAEEERQTEFNIL